VELSSRDGNAAHWLPRTGGFVLSRSRLHDDNVESIACDTLADLLSSVADSSLDQDWCDRKRNRGDVSATIDGLVFDHELVIVQEIVIPIRLHLLARPGVAIED